MAELDIRAERQADLANMVRIPHKSRSEFAYKLDLRSDKTSFASNFERVYLPRPVNIKYPKDETTLIHSWADAAAIFVGLVMGELVAYVALENQRIRDTARVTDLVVAPLMRRKGVGSGLLLACEAWAHEQKARRVLMEIQMRNDPAVQMVKKLGYQMCGYLDQYFPNHDPALFFDKPIN